MRLRRRLSDTPHPLRTRTRNSIRHEIRTVARHPDNFTHIFIYYLCAKGAKSGARSAVCECDKREAIRLREPASRRVASKQNHASARNSHAHISNCVCRTHTHTHAQVFTPRMRVVCMRYAVESHPSDARAPCDRMAAALPNKTTLFMAYSIKIRVERHCHMCATSLSLWRAHTHTQLTHTDIYLLCAYKVTHKLCVCVFVFTRHSRIAQLARTEF